MQTWIQNIIEALDESSDEITKQQIMEKCGANCPFSHMPNEKLISLRDSSESEHDLLNTLCDTWRLQKRNGLFYMVFDQCYCPLVKDPKQTSKTLCYCTLGNLKQKFKLALGRSVGVHMEKTILAGDDECCFAIDISEKRKE